MASDFGAPVLGRGLSHLEPPVSWSAIFAGAVTALAVSFLLTLLAAGFGYTLIPGGLASRGSIMAFTPALGGAAVAIQAIAAGVGGFVTGRLRHQWLSAHSDEAHFRDTAHGFVAWALATVVGLVLAARVFTPYAESVALIPAPQLSPVDIDRAGHIVSQAAFFTAIGMLLSAFVAAVAARLGGMESEHMHEKHMTLSGRLGAAEPEAPRPEPVLQTPPPRPRSRRPTSGDPVLR